MSRMRFGVLLTTLLAGGTAMPSDVWADGWSGAYLGGNFGRARSSYDTGSIDAQIQNVAIAEGDTLNFSARSIRRMSDAWWADAGYFFTPYVGIDAGFFHVGEMKYLAVGTVAIAGVHQSVSTAAEVSSHGPALSFIGRLPLTEFFETDLRIGDYLGKGSWDNVIGAGSRSVATASSKSGSGLLAGIGAAGHIGGHWSIRLDYLRVNQSGDGDSPHKFTVNLATAGVRFSF